MKHLAHLNDFLTRHMSGRVHVVAGAVLLAIWVLVAYQQSRLSGPPRNTEGDEPDYDCIACQLRKGGRFAVDFRDADYLRPYAETAHSYPEQVANRVNGLTTYRPPLLPIVMAATYGSDVSLRRFEYIRILNLAAAAATIALSAWLARLAAGGLASCFSFASLCYIGLPNRYALLLMTESLAGLFVTAALAVGVAGSFKRPALRGAVVGGIWGVAILTRPSLIFWVPAMAVGLWVLAKRAGESPRRRLWVTSCYLSLTLVPLVPWAIHNCLLLDAFMPLGCQGMTELPAGFSDNATRTGGIWEPLPENFPMAPLALPEFERSRAEQGQAAAASWLRTHLLELPNLTAMKIWNEWKPRSRAQLVILPLMLVGIIAYRGHPFGVMCSAAVVGDLMMIGSTWSVEGRFVYPALGAVHALAGAGFWVCVRGAFQRNLPVNVHGE